MIKLARTALLALSTLSVAQAADADAKVTTMKNIGDITGFDMYSGYVNVTDTGKQIFYTFVTSQNKPTEDPLIIWYNGGPGCSSLKGFIQENGPNVINDGGDVEKDFYKNEFAWNTNASVLYFDQPAGVGYSYCNNDTDSCKWDDATSSDDNIKVVNEWFKVFPEFKPNDLWLSGESYAGIYVPYLVHQIDQQNGDAESDADKINLKGMMVGNGVTNWKYDCDNAMVEVLYARGFYSQELYDQMKSEKCDYTDLEFDNTITDSCKSIYNEIMDGIAYVDPYNIYSTCYYTPANKLSLKGEEVDTPQRQKKGTSIREYSKWTNFGRKFPMVNAASDDEDVVENLMDGPDCSWGQPLVDYFNDAEVRTQLHVLDYIGKYDFCSEIDFTMLIKGSQWIYEDLRNKYSFLHYSGDKDSIVAGVGTLGWINSLGWDVTDEWKPYYVDKQVAGYVEARDGLTFATVHGAGHMVPQDQRAIAHHLIYSFMRGDPL